MARLTTVVIPAREAPPALRTARENSFAAAVAAEYGLGAAPAEAGGGDGDAADIAGAGVAAAGAAVAAAG